MSQVILIVDAWLRARDRTLEGSSEADCPGEDGERSNVIIVETVGVGQSETAVEDLVDFFLLLAPPAGGDHIQGIKKGVMEMADVIVVNKADGALVPVARKALSEYRTALNLLKPKAEHWRPQV